MKNMASEISGFAAIKVAVLVSGLIGAMLAISVVPASAAFAGQQGLVSARPFEVGTTFIAGGNTYKVTEAYESAHDLGEVRLVKYGSDKLAPTFNTVKHNGKTYEVDEIGKNAFNNAKGHRITSVKLGKHVDEIKAKAFYGCSRLKVVDIAKSDVIEIKRSKSTGNYYIDDLDMGKKAFSKAGTNGVKVKCGSSDAAYQSLVKKAFVGKGLNKNVKVVK